jgi:hypothetical protein
VREATAEARTLLRHVVLPPGTRRLGKPSLDLGGQEVDLNEDFATPGMSPTTVRDFAADHRPAGTTSQEGRGEGSKWGVPNEWNVFWPTSPNAAIAEGQFDVTAVVSPNGGSKESVDISLTWQYPHPRTAIVPLDVSGAEVTLVKTRDEPPGEQKRAARHSVHLFPGPKLTRLVRGFDRLPVAPYGAESLCTFFTTYIRVTFPKTDTSPPIVADTSSCGDVYLTIGGKPGPTLNLREEWGWQDELNKLLGIRD